MILDLISFDEKFWTAVAFIIFIILIYKPVKKILLNNLDEKIEQITQNIKDGEKIKEEAQILHTRISKRQHDLKNETLEIEKNAKERLATIKKEMDEKFEIQIKRRKDLNDFRIKQIEIDARKEINNIAIDLTIEKTKELLSNKLEVGHKEAIIKDSLLEVEKSLKN